MVHRAWAALPRAEALLASRTPTTAVSVDEAHDTISAVFCDHHLAPLERREVNMNLRSVRDAGVGIELLDYGEAVRIHVGGGLENFHLVQIPLRGRATMEVGNALVQSSSRVATVPPLDREFTMRWDTGVPTLILYAERSRLRTVAEAMYGVDGERLQLGLHLHLDTVVGGDFLRALLDHHSVLERGSADGAYARRLSAELLLTRLLSAVDNSVTRSLGTWASVERVRVTPGTRWCAGSRIASRGVLRRGRVCSRLQRSLSAVAHAAVARARGARNHADGAAAGGAAAARAYAPGGGGSAARNRDGNRAACRIHTPRPILDRVPEAFRGVTG
ncbi:hypothetical protein K1X41_12295 [Leucobacter luti]|nr:hypothetical protein [Leucobacter luti]QYM75404.1 hypothetical protein K1X41_12295 [Leucobacter luti]